MHNAEIGRVVSLVGLGIQSAGAILLAGLFALLVHAGERRAYFRAWTAAWIVLAVALACVGVFFAGAPSWAELPLLAGYQAGKTVFFLLLLAGARSFASAAPAWRPGALGAVVLLAFVAVSLLVTRDVGSLMALQSLVAVPCLVAALVHLTRVGPRRRSFGVQAMCGSVACLALLWVVYLVLNHVEPRLEGRVNAMAMVMAVYNSYVDLLLQTVLGFGMVLVASEEAHRELEAAHGQLNAAHEQLRGEALRDALTGALNRRAFSTIPEADPVLENGGCAILLDFDGFKEVNDRYGHAAGDALLRHFVEEMRQRLRESDLLYRLGGDEFLVIVPGATPERLQARFAEMLETVPPLALDGGRQLKLRASWGLAGFTSTRDLTEALREADRAMYATKPRPPAPGSAAGSVPA